MSLDCDFACSAIQIQIWHQFIIWVSIDKSSIFFKMLAFYFVFYFYFLSLLICYHSKRTHTKSSRKYIHKNANFYDIIEIVFSSITDSFVNVWENVDLQNSSSYLNKSPHLKPYLLKVMVLVVGCCWVSKERC